MGTLFDAHDRAVILERIGRLREDTRPLWGRFTASQMVCHVSSGLRNGLDEIDLGPPAGPLTRWPINWLLIHLVPFPKNAKAAPEMLATKPTTWAADLAALRDLVERFGARGPDAAWPPSKVFGRISGRSWGVLQHKHLDHHLRQFGV